MKQIYLIMMLLASALSDKSWAVTSQPPNCAQSVKNISSTNEAVIKALEKKGNASFDLFVVAISAQDNLKWWNDSFDSLLEQNMPKISKLYRSIPFGQTARAERLLLVAQDEGLRIPDEFLQKVNLARIKRDLIRQQEIKVFGSLTEGQQKDLTRMFQLIGIRRSKFERLYEKTRETLGLESREMVPLIQSDKALHVLGDEARLLLLEYNKKVEQSFTPAQSAYKELLKSLYALYTLRVFQSVQEPWFTVNGAAQNLENFINMGAYYQPDLAPSNKWMTVGRIPPEYVQNPFAKAAGFTREMWWNRLKGINPIGTVRIARNIKVHSDGREELVSVEVLHKDRDGIFVPYLFERDSSGRFKLNTSEEGRKKTQSCFACHLRLTGVFFGGITQPGYKAAPQWYVNGIDFTQWKFHGMFEGLVQQPK